MSRPVSARRRRLPGVGRVEQWKSLDTLVWLPAMIVAGIYLVVFAARFTTYVGALDWVSDYASGFTVPETVAQAGSGGHTVISTTGAWLPLWFGLLTANLPLHRQLWEAAPTALFYFSALTIGWSVAQVAGRRAAVLATLIVVIASQWALAFFMAAVAHNTVYPATALLGAYLIWLTRMEERRRAIKIAVPAVAALVLGVCIASDALLLVTGVIPFALSAVVCASRRPGRSRRVLLYAWGTALCAAPVAVVTSTLMRNAGFVTTPPPFSISPLADIVPHARLLYGGLQQLFNGYLADASWPGTLHPEIGYACDAAMIGALLTVLIYGTRCAVRLLRSAAATDTASSPPIPDMALGLHVTYWALSAVLVCAAFVFSNTAGGTMHESYYATTIFSAAAIVPLLLRSRSPMRWLIPAGVSIFFVGSFVGAKWDYVRAGTQPLAHYASTIVAIAEANDATTGYAGYWDASGLTWNTDEKVIVRPLQQCSNPAGAGICPFFLMRVPAWYVPKKRHTFLLVDPTNLYVTSRPSGLGNPIATYTVGPVDMFVYPYDIASRLGPPTT
jgi:hypothetical protein